MMEDFLIKNGTIVTMDDKRRIITDGAVACSGSKIIDVGKTEELSKKYRLFEIIDAKNKLVMPGFINAHCHAIQHLNRGLFVGLGATPWLEALWKYYWPQIKKEELHTSAMFMALEMIKTGTTCFVDCGTHPLYGQQVVKAVEKSGIKAVLGRSASDIHKPPLLPPEALRETTESAIKNGEAFVKRWDHAANGRIRAWFQLHQIFNCTDELCLAAKENADRYGVGILTHAAVHSSMNEISLKRFGSTEIERLNRLGVLGPNLLATHMGWITEKELYMLKEQNVKVCHCPSASLFFSYGSFIGKMFPRMLDAGVTVALGTDGGNCSNFMDMVREMYLASACHKEVTGDPKIMPAEKVLEMATINGAKALLMDGEIGSIEKGKNADIIFFDLQKPEWIPSNKYSILNNLVYSANGSSVDTVMINGKIIMENRKVKTFKEQMVLEKAQKTGEKIIEKLEEGGHAKLTWDVE